MLSSLAQRRPRGAARAGGRVPALETVLEKLLSTQPACTAAIEKTKERSVASSHATHSVQHQSRRNLPVTFRFSSWCNSPLLRRKRTKERSEERSADKREPGISVDSKQRDWMLSTFYLKETLQRVEEHLQVNKMSLFEKTGQEYFKRQSQQAPQYQ